MDVGMVMGWGILYGLAVSGVFSLVALVGVALAPDVMLRSYPPAIRERYGTQSVQAQRVARIGDAVAATMVTGSSAAASCASAR